MRLPSRTRALAVIATVAIAGVAFVGGLAAGTSKSDHPPSSRSASGRRAPAPPPRVSVYGDSLTVQAAPYLTGLARAFQLTVSVHAFSGTAPCDFLAPLRHELATRPPAVVLFAFSGNSIATCMLDAAGHPFTGDAVVAKYRTDTETAADMATGAHRPFLVASPPAPRGKQAIWKQLDDVYRTIAATHVGVQYIDAGQDIAPGGDFMTTQQCLPYETHIPGAASSCGSAESDITVRGPDGGHFCGNTGAADAVVCPTYSSGAMRYAVNIISAARLILDAPATRAGL